MNKTALLFTAAGLALLPGLAFAAEGGTTHVVPGDNATLIDLAPAAPGSFFKPMLMNYSGSVSAKIPTAAGVTSNLDAEADAFVLGGGYTFDQTVGVAYQNNQIGFNAMIHGGYAMNTENPDTNYQSGAVLHFAAAIEQILPMGSGFLTLGAEGF
jgi:hypothetical protein